MFENFEDIRNWSLKWSTRETMCMLLLHYIFIIGFYCLLYSENQKAKLQYEIVNRNQLGYSNYLTLLQFYNNT